MSSNTWSIFRFLCLKNIFLHLIWIKIQTKSTYSIWLLALPDLLNFFFLLLLLPFLSFSSSHFLLQKPGQLSSRVFLISDLSVCFLVVLTCFSILCISCKMEVSFKGSIRFRVNFFGKLEMLHRWCCVHHIASHQEIHNMFVSYFQWCEDWSLGLSSDSLTPVL